MDSENKAQILDKIVCNSIIANALKKSIYSSLLSSE